MATTRSRAWLGKAGRRYAVLIAAVLLGVVAAAVIPADALYIQPAKHTSLTAGDQERYACPMLCVITDHPGKCPQCGMEMAPIADYGGAVTTQQAGMIGLEVAAVRRLPLVRHLRTVGRFELDETLTERVTAWIPGRVDRLYPEVIGSVVRAGDPLFEVFSPTLYSAQVEHLANLRSLQELPVDSPVRADLSQIVEHSRERLRLLGMTVEQVQGIETAGAQTHITITAPQAGVVIERFIDEGEYVREGTPLLKIASLGRLWLLLDIDEIDLPLVRTGQRVDITTRANPGLPTEGTVDFIEPVVDPRTRTTRVRITLPNPLKTDAEPPPDGLAPPRHFAPGMFADATMQLRLGTADSPMVIAVPVKAVLDSGERSIVYLRTGASDNGATFELRDVVLGPIGVGPDGRQYRLVLDGLTPSQVVATNGNFLLDSQAQLQGNPSLFFPTGSAQPADPHAGHNH